jgi:exonuclease VII large subunit
MVAVGWGAVGDLAGPAAVQERIAHLEDENAALRDEQQQLEDEQQRLKAERERLRGENEWLRVEGERLQEVNERLRAEVEALRRAAKRQAAPFSKGDPKPDPKCRAQARRVPWDPRAPAPTRAGRPGRGGRAAGMLSRLRRRAGLGAGGDPACRGSARALPAQHPL